MEANDDCDVLRIPNYKNEESLEHDKTKVWLEAEDIGKEQNHY
jgi:hypothetical protein